MDNGLHSSVIKIFKQCYNIKTEIALLSDRFAAEVFHELQEEVMITSSRSRKLMGRVQQIDKALPPLEKAVLGQRSHLHLAYTAGMVNCLALTFTHQQPFSIPSSSTVIVGITLPDKTLSGPSN